MPERTVFRNAAHQHCLLRIDIAVIPFGEYRHSGKILYVAEQQQHFAPFRGACGAAGRVIIRQFEFHREGAFFGIAKSLRTFADNQNVSFEYALRQVPEAAQRQQTVLKNRPAVVNQHYVEVCCEPSVLEGIIEQHSLRALLLKAPAAFHPILIYRNLDGRELAGNL